jgi:hypothetical protein
MRGRLAYILLFMLSIIAHGENNLIISDIAVAGLDTAWIPVEIENTDEIVSFQFDLSFPNGFTYSGVSHLTDRSLDHELYVDMIDGSLRVLAISNSLSPFDGSSGPVVVLGLMAPAENDTFDLVLSDAILGNADSENVINGIEDGIVIVTSPAPQIIAFDNVIVLEDSSFTLEYDTLISHVSDVNTPVESLIWSFQADSLTIVPIGNNYQIQPVTDWFGIDSVIISATDGIYTSSTTLIVEVIPINDEPIAPNLLVPVDGWLANHLGVIFEWTPPVDVDNDSLTTSFLIQQPTGVDSTIVIGTSTFINLSDLNLPYDEPINWWVEVSDGQSVTSSQLFSFTVPDGLYGSGTTWYVSEEGFDDSGDGSESNPFRSIQHGIIIAESADTVLVHPGTYFENINYLGKAIILGSLALTSGDTAYIHQTMIDGNQASSVVSIIDILTGTALLDGFNLVNGLAETGGGISITNSSVIVRNCIIEDNQSSSYGGGIYVENTLISLQGTSIRNNEAIDSGGGFCALNNSSLSMTTTLISNNISQDGSGGGIFTSVSSGTLSNSSIVGNSASASGGGVLIQSSLDAWVMDHVVIAKNTTTGIGGGYWLNGTNSILTNCTITGNIADENAGGYASVYGANTVFTNCILTANLPEQVYAYPEGEENLITISYTDIEGGQEAIITNGNATVNWLNGNFNLDPLFVDPIASEYHLQNSSPCIDTGNPDLDGDGDIWAIDIDDQDLDGTRFDMGAYFYNQTDSIAPSLTLNFPEITEVPHNGDTLLVTWVASDNFGLDWAKLWFSSDGGESFTLSDSMDASLGQVNWITPDVISNSCKLAIWVSDLSGNISADTLDATFPIDDGTLPTITVLTPIISSAIPEGDTLYVSWEAHDNVGIEWFDLYYYNDPSSIETSSFNIPATERSFAFEIPRPGVSDSAQIRIEVMDLAANINSDYSEYFSITDNTSPVISHLSIPDTSAFGIGSRMDIQISATDNVQVTGLDLNYSIDAGATWGPIIQGLFPVAGRPTYSWLIPDIPGDCQIQAIITDAVALTDTSYSELFTVTIEYPVLHANLPLIKPSMDMHLSFSQAMATGISVGIQVTGSVGGEYEVEGTMSGTDVTISAIDGFVSLDTLMLVLLASEWTNAFGYGLDGNKDGIYEGSPIDNDTSYTFVSAAGDYDQNNTLDFDDFNTFVIAWNNNATDYELAPHSGEIPIISIQPDSSFDIYDLATFASMWNWFAGAFQSSPQFGGYDVVSMDADQNGNSLLVNLENNEFIASQTIIKYDPEIVSVSVSDPSLAKVSSSSMVLVNANPDSGYITITSSQLSGAIEDQLNLELIPRTKQEYSIEVAIQGSDANGSVTQKRTSIDLIPIPTTYSLSQNYPNPFNASTMIEYGLPSNSELNISIFDIRGRFVKEMHSGPQQAGYHAIQWNGLNDNGQGVASGVYFIVLNAPEYRVARKALILK